MKAELFTQFQICSNNAVNSDDPTFSDEFKNSDRIKYLSLPACFHSFPDLLVTIFSLERHSTTTLLIKQTGNSDCSNINDGGYDEM